MSRIRQRVCFYSVAIICSATMLTGCITRPETVQDNVPLAPGSGFIVFQLESDFVDGQLSIVDYTAHIGNAEIIRENIQGPNLAVKVREPYKLWVLTLPAGEYSWSRFAIGRGGAAMLQAAHFRVESGKMNYIGSVKLSAGKNQLLQFRDHEETATRLLSISYPMLFRQYPFAKNLTVVDSLCSLC